MEQKSRQNIKPFLLFIAWLIALLATISAIYASLILKMPVCELCWWQRICLFPLAIQLGIATFRQNLDISCYTLPLVVIGGLIALYQYLLQKVPALQAISLCRSGPGTVNCSAIDWQIFGFVTIPLLSLAAFIILFFLLWLVVHKKSIKILRDGGI